MRYTLHFWLCGLCHKKNGPDKRVCACGQRRFERNARIHASERSVIFQHPVTGERRVPARADQPMPEVYARQGFERREIESMIQYERETGTVHEASNFHPGNEPSEPAQVPYSAPAEVKQDLIDEVRKMIASGPVTDSSPPD